MGLDIYHYKVLKEATAESTRIGFAKEETNKARILAEEMFKDNIEIVDNEYMDVDTYLKENGYDKGWQMVGQSYNGPHNSFLSMLKQEEDGSYDYSNGERKEINMDKLATIIQKDKELNVQEIGYQRKGMNSDFYTKFVSGCWYINTDTELAPEDSIEIISTQEQFDKMKTFSDGGPVNYWEFIEGEDLIYLSY